MKRMILFLGLGSLLTLSCTKRYTTIIGGADQPTAIFIADPLTLQGKGLELTCQMHRLANNETYIKYCSPQIRDFPHEVLQTEEKCAFD